MKAEKFLILYEIEAMTIQENLHKIKQAIPAGVKLVAVSKTKPIEDIQLAYDAGHKSFGENKAQELAGKQPKLPLDIEWHFIGHLQRNKVKYIAPFVSLVHGVDSFRLLAEINKQAAKNKRLINCLLQFHIATEQTKFGFSLAEAREILSSQAFQELKSIKICGVMGMATFTSEEAQIRNEFRNLKMSFDTLKKQFFANDDFFREISAGMSNDFQIAIEEGSTLVRIGSDIFGARSH